MYWALRGGWKFSRKPDSFLKTIWISTRTTGFQAFLQCDRFSVSEQDDISCPNSQFHLVPGDICPIMVSSRMKEYNRALCASVSRFWRTLTDICPKVLLWLVISLEACCRRERRSEVFGSPKIYSKLTEIGKKEEKPELKPNLANGEWYYLSTCILYCDYFSALSHSFLKGPSVAAIYFHLIFSFAVESLLCSFDQILFHRLGCCQTQFWVARFQTLPKVQMRDLIFWCSWQ